MEMNRPANFKETWLSCEDKYIHANGGKMTTPEIAKALGRTVHAVRQRAATISATLRGKAQMKYSYETVLEIRRLYDEESMRPYDIAKKLGTNLRYTRKLIHYRGIRNGK